MNKLEELRNKVVKIKKADKPEVEPWEDGVYFFMYVLSKSPTHEEVVQHALKLNLPIPLQDEMGKAFSDYRKKNMMPTKEDIAAHAEMLMFI